jgi:hypothetical protein
MNLCTCPDVRALQSADQGSVGWRPKGRTMIDWDSETWGNVVNFAANGSWVTDKHGDEDAEQD